MVRIDVREVAFDEGARRLEAGIGSGVLLSADGLILTNAHVVGPRAIEINVTLANLERVEAKLIGWDHWTDLALLRLDMDAVAPPALTVRPRRVRRQRQVIPAKPSTPSARPMASPAP